MFEDPLCLSPSTENADAWSHGYEAIDRGTNPLSVDTDQDGVGDSSDLDPLRNLLVAVKVKKVHHGASPWCTPELVGTARVNGDYTWVTEHRMASEDVYWSGGCLSDIASTAAFGLTYYADVPDDTSSVSVRGTGWSVNGARWDDPLVDVTVGYTLQSGTAYHTVWNGNSWMSFEVSTHALPKAKTLLVTDGNATVTASNGEHGLTGQDRNLVFTFDVTSAYAPFVVGANAVVVPRSLFLESKLKADFSANNHWPLADATLYGEDLGRADVTEGVAGVIAKSLSGSNAYNVLDRLLRNTTNVLVYSYVDITSYALRANLPVDVVRILPWEKVTNGPTGTPPDGMPGFVNVLVQLGQLFYDGLVALVTFLVNLAEAIWDWGMRALGAVSAAVAGVVQKVADALSSLFAWIAEHFANMIKGAIDFIASTVRTDIEEIVRLVRSFGAGPASATGESTPMPLAFLPLASALWKVKDKIEDTFDIAEKAETGISMVLMATGIAGPLKAILTKITMDAIKKALLGIVIGTTVGVIVQDILGIANKDAVESLAGKVFGVGMGVPLIVMGVWEVFEKFAEKKQGGSKSKFAIAFSWALAGFALQLLGTPMLDELFGSATGWPLLLLDVFSAVMEIVALLIMSGKTVFKTGPISTAINWLTEHFGQITTSTEKIVTSLSATSTFVSIGAHVASQDYWR